MRRYVWFRNLVNEEALAHWGLSPQIKKNFEALWDNKCTMLLDKREVRNDVVWNNNWENGDGIGLIPSVPGYIYDQTYMSKQENK